MIEPTNDFEKMIAQLDKDISELLAEQEKHAEDPEKWGFRQVGINRLNDKRYFLIKNFSEKIRDEFFSSPNYRD